MTQKKYRDKLGRFIKGHPLYGGMVGRKHSKEAKEKIGTANKGNRYGWIHGRGHEPYCEKFARRREQVRARDNWSCQDCGAPQEEFQRALGIHHIDENKDNNNLTNLITLCPKCHGIRHRRKAAQSIVEGE